jgi:hypothetical protein
LHRAGVATGNSQDQSAQRDVADLDEQVHVIVHPAVCVDARLNSFDDVGGDLLEESPIVWNDKDVLTMIASERYVVERAGHVDAGLAGHPCL